MTREEKIKGLYNLKEYLVENPIELEGHKSLPITLIDYAIEALEQQPCEDCISRQAVKEAIMDCETFYEDRMDTFIATVLEIKIDNLPSVTPQTDILDKIKAEIEQTVSRYSISRERGCIGQVEWSDRLIKESEVLEIIDKYRKDGERVTIDEAIKKMWEHELDIGDFDKWGDKK